MLKYIETNQAPAAIGPYSQAIEAGNMLFLSGVIPVNPETGELVEADIRVQTEQITKNIKALLDAAEYQVSDVVKTTCFLANISDFAAFNEVYATFFTSKPARSCVAVKDIPKGALVEVEVTAYKNN